jgi:hypothetical protein
MQAIEQVSAELKSHVKRVDGSLLRDVAKAI